MAVAWLMMAPALLLASAQASATSGDRSKATGSQVDLRAAAALSAPMPRTVQRDQEVIERARPGAWVRAEIVGSGGSVGWVHGALLAAPRPARWAWRWSIAWASC